MKERLEVIEEIESDTFILQHSDIDDENERMRLLDWIASKLEDLDELEDQELLLILKVINRFLAYEETEEISEHYGFIFGMLFEKPEEIQVNNSITKLVGRDLSLASTRSRLRKN